jgi:hypothetical protein
MLGTPGANLYASAVEKRETSEVDKAGIRDDSLSSGTPANVRHKCIRSVHHRSGDGTPVERP